MVEIGQGGKKTAHSANIGSLWTTYGTSDFLATKYFGLVFRKEERSKTDSDM